MKNIVILGSTGTVGENALEVIRRGKDRFRVLALACRNRKKLLAGQIKEFAPKFVYIEKKDVLFEKRFPGVKFLYGESGLEEIATLKAADILIWAVPGIGTLKAAVSAVTAGKTIGLATKEILVVAGHIVRPLADKCGACILPVDSEHNAIFQALSGVKKREIEKIYLTASGGPFWGRPAAHKVAPEDVLNHPVWKMGKKITVDSATMMNKAFEIIEAHYLFDIPAEKINVLIHPEAVVHGMVEMTDGTIKAVLSVPDMKFPVNFVLDYPVRRETPWRKLDFGEIKKLTLLPADRGSAWFSLAAEAIEKKGSFPVVLNAANEEAVDLFLKGRIEFGDIVKVVRETLKRHNFKKAVSVEDILRIHNDTKQVARTLACSE